MCCPQHVSYWFLLLPGCHKQSSFALSAFSTVMFLPCLRLKAKSLELLAKNILPFNFLLRYFVIVLGNLTQGRKKELELDIHHLTI